MISEKQNYYLLPGLKPVSTEGSTSVWDGKNEDNPNIPKRKTGTIIEDPAIIPSVKQKKICIQWKFRMNAIL